MAALDLAAWNEGEEPLWEMDEMFKQRFQLAIDESGLSVQEVADAAGMSREAVYKLLQGKSHGPSLENLKMLSRVLRVSLMWLGWGDGDMRGDYADLPLDGESILIGLSASQLDEKDREFVKQTIKMLKSKR
jgi:transcriptional regulator with XRE-family HTH domain